MVYTSATVTKSVEQQGMRTAIQQVLQTIPALQLALPLIDHLFQAQRRYLVVRIAYEGPCPSLWVGSRQLDYSDDFLTLFAAEY